MRLPRIFSDVAKLKVGDEFYLAASPSKHILQVLRLKINNELIVFNGDGCEYLAVIISIKDKSAKIKITQSYLVHTESPLKLQLVQGICRSERMDFAIQKSVELGVEKVLPCFTEYCQLKLNSERLQKKQTHWQQVAVHAAEQSGRVTKPLIQSPQKLADWLLCSPQQVIVCEPQAEQKIHTLELDTTKALSLVIGPEGGLSTAEIEQLKQAGAKTVSLGPRILRTESAAMVALTLLQNCFGDL